MTREEAIEILGQRFDSSCRNNLFQNAKKLDYEDALWMAISALRSTQQLGKPLTLEQLREMQCEKVVLYRMKSTEPLETGTVKENGDVLGDAGTLAYHELYLETWVAFSVAPAQQRWIKEANTPPTNGDHVRAMDNKELSKWLCSIMTGECCDMTCPGREFCEHGHNGLLDWVQATYKED